MPYNQVLVVGGGLAGLRAAIEAADRGVDVAVLSLVPPVRSHSGAAQGGVNGALANAEDGRDDTPERHAFDTVKGSDYLGDQDAIQIMADEAPARIIEMEHWGCPFSRTKDGKIAQRPFGGGGFPRTCYAADKTGHYMLHTLYEQAVKRRVKVYMEWASAYFVVDGRRVGGVVAFHLPTGQFEAFQADAVIMATGGYGRIYARSTNAIINTGYGMAMAYLAGAPLEDMEFVQFHPTTLLGNNILMTEGARGEGGLLFNAKGERFMERYAPTAKDLAPRDMVARAIQTEINEGRGFPGGYVNLDLRRLGKQKIMERLPGIRDICISFSGVDPITDPIPIQPGQHYSMGGIGTDVWGQSELPGLFAAGECACVSVHGANRLGGNSLLDTVLFGKRAGERAAQVVKGKPAPRNEKAAQAALERVRKAYAGLIAGTGKEDPNQIRDEMRESMFELVGIFRTQDKLVQAVRKLGELSERYRRVRACYDGKKFNWDLVRTFELGGQLLVAEVIAKGALARQESRGSHYRVDFPNRDDQSWLKHTLAHYSSQGPVLKYKPVTVAKWQPEARKY
ncbi:MAG: FAD-dependent oxidoreductase [Chloroflexi bacterium]|nr:FAD-dependent oxidoreductase [Chloroflexota bacterium]